MTFFDALTYEQKYFILNKLYMMVLSLVYEYYKSGNLSINFFTVLHC